MVESRFDMDSNSSGPTNSQYTESIHGVLNVNYQCMYAALMSYLLGRKGMLIG